MLEHAIYSVISPEGCASILWRDANQKSIAADALKLTAQDLRGLRIIDEIVPEPVGARTGRRARRSRPWDGWCRPHSGRCWRWTGRR